VPYAEIPPAVRELAEDLIFNRRPDVLPRYIAYFEEHKAAGAEQTAAIDPTASMTAEQKLHWQIVHRRKEGVEALIDDCLTRNQPVWVLNNVLLPAMKEVGDKFGAGELILPYVLQSAEVMKKSVTHLEQFLEKKEGGDQRQDRAGNGVRRRPRHWQEPGRHDPFQQRLHCVRLGQAERPPASSLTRRWR